MTSIPPVDPCHWRACFSCGHFSQPPTGPDCASCCGAPWNRSGWCARPAAAVPGRPEDRRAHPPPSAAEDCEHGASPRHRAEDELPNLEEALGWCGVGPRQLHEHPAPEPWEET